MSDEPAIAAADLDFATARSRPEGESPLPVSVVGCGNWLDRNDRVGPRVLAALFKRAPEDAELTDVGTSVLGLLDRLRGQELLILVDACIGRAQPGQVVICEPLPSEPLQPVTSLHQVGPLDTLAVARELFPERMPGRTVMVLVETGGLDPASEGEACGRAVTAVLEQIARWRLEHRIVSTSN